MIDLHLVTGHGNEPHVTAADQGAFNAQTIGTGSYVLNIGNKFSAAIDSNSTVLISSGDLYMQGRFIRMTDGETGELTFDNGVIGQKRNDLIVCSYLKNPDTGIETAKLQVIKGTPSAGEPQDPEIITGDIINGNANRNDYPLYRVAFEGINLTEITPLFSVMKNTVEDITKQDFVVEQGTSDDWFYRKWNSGYCELMKNHQYSNQAVSYMKVSGLDIDFPASCNPTARGVDKCVVQACNNFNPNFSGNTIFITSVWASQTKFRMCIFGDAPSNLSINIYIRGFWK